MEVTSRTHLHLRFQNTIFTLLLLTITALIAWLSIRYEIKADWTINNRHTLSEASKQILVEQLTEPLTITAYASSHNNELRLSIRSLIERYQREKLDINLRFVDPFLVPGEVRERGVQVDGEIIIDYQGRIEHVRTIPLSEQDLTAALQRIARTDRRLIVFLEGHGERNPTQFTDYDFNQFAQKLENSGFEVQTLNFGNTNQIPENTSVLVIATPKTQLLPGEVTRIEKYIDVGGNLLWLLDPGKLVSDLGLDTLIEKWGLTVNPNLIVDPVSQFLGVDNPAIVSITTDGYAYHPVTSGFKEYLTLFPQASALTVNPSTDWEETALLTTNSQTWVETGELQGTVSFDEGTDIQGPLQIAFAFTRNKPESRNPSNNQTTSEESEIENRISGETLQIQDALPTVTTKQDSKTLTMDNFNEDSEPVIQEQRVIVVGEGDFLSNAYFQYGGNSDLGLKMLNWLAEDDSFVSIPTKTAVDLSLQLSTRQIILLGAFFLIVLPIILMTIGLSVWLRRRKV